MMSESKIRYGLEVCLGHKTKTHTGLWLDCFNRYCWHCFMCDEPKKALRKLRKKMTRRKK